MATVTPLPLFSDYQKLYDADVAAATASPAIAKDPPAGMIYMDGYSGAEVIFYGSVNNATVVTTIYAIRRIGGLNDADRLYVPVPVGGMIIVVGNTNGVDGSKVPSTRRFVDTVPLPTSTLGMMEYLAEVRAGVSTFKNIATHSPVGDSVGALLLANSFSLAGWAIGFATPSSGVINALVGKWSM